MAVEMSRKLREGFMWMVTVGIWYDDPAQDEQATIGVSISDIKCLNKAEEWLKGRGMPQGIEWRFDRWTGMWISDEIDVFNDDSSVAFTYTFAVKQIPIL